MPLLSMATTTPINDLNSPQASGNGSENLYYEHQGNTLTTLNDELALEHILDNLSDEKVLNTPLGRSSRH